ncbi:MAG: helix-turn-helix domain-containing protein [Bacteroidota bacterium]|nr:helix-turn-helix domain-containing protein [Bacteroidota bacterium]
MKHISILVPQGAAVLGCIEGAFKTFTIANTFLESKGKPALFNVKLVGLTREARIYDKLFTVQPNHAISEVEKTDLIIIPPVNGMMEKVISINKDFFPWINKQYIGGAEVASLCMGSFLLAATGLLKGKKCSTHWIAQNDFRKMFPDVHLASDKVITDEQGIYSSGGANSFWNLLLYIVEKYTSRDLAVQIAKYYEIEIDRDNQSSFIMFKGQKDHEDEPIKKAQEYIENNFNRKITVDQLASMVAIGRRNLERRFKKATSNTVVEYIQRVKIEAAKISLESSRENVNEVMYKVGYADTKAFRNTFKKITGLSPVQYRNKYHREISYKSV